MIPAALSDHLRKARHVVALTGAGVSAESGVPTFRDSQTGLWERYRPEELATPEAFLRNPRRVWDWYTWRKKLVGEVQPNPGHYALVVIENQVHDFTLITQNVDGLHQRAGSQKVLELHGNIQRMKCFDEGMEVPEDSAIDDFPPRCPRCEGLLRPDVVWFGELLPAEVLDQAMNATRVCDTFFSVGTSTLVHPAAELPWMALEHGAVVIEINPQVTPLTDQATYVLQGLSGVILPELVQAVWG